MADESSSDDTMSSQLKENPKTIIIGAGISGMAAASVLNNSRYNDFEILEATDRTGGRIWSIDLDSANDTKAELGANWIHGVDANPIFKICKQHGLITPQYIGRKLGKKVIFLQDNGDPVNAKVVEEVDFVYGMLMSQVEEFYQDHVPTPLENDSVGAFVEREFCDRFDRYQGYEFHTRKMILEQRLLGESVIAGSHDMHDVSLSEIGAFEELPGMHYVIPPGFESVVHVIEKEIPTEKIHLNHSVSQITWNNSASSNSKKSSEYPICVECQNGKRFYADHVIVTCSLGYLKKYSDRLFNPELPGFKKDAIKSLQFGTVNKIILEFDGQVLPGDVTRLEMVWDRDLIENGDIQNNWFKKIVSFEAIEENILVGWLSGKEAEYMETLDDETISKKCSEVLKMFLKKTTKNIPNLKKMTRSCWKSQPYSLGSYCYIPVGALAEHVEYMSEPVTDGNKPVLLFAGEATHPTFYSSSHGALLSGQREANRLINLYTNGGH